MGVLGIAAHQGIHAQELSSLRATYTSRIRTHSLSFLFSFAVQQYFTDRLAEILRKNKKGKVVAWHEFWESGLNLKQLDDVIIENWMQPSHLPKTLKQGLRSINAAGWYLGKKDYKRSRSPNE
jgi:hypothetical protein